VPRDRFEIESFHHPSPNKSNVITSEGGHFLSENVAAFDAPFFNLTASEALAMDPQQRLLLEVSYEAFENAGLLTEELAGSNTGCFVGCFTKDYSDMIVRDSETSPQYAATGTSASILSNRISWFYDLKGPSLTLDTACSSSLVGVHLACQSLQLRETNMAIVGGSNLILNPDLSMWLSNLHMLAPDGLSKAFDSRADGYGRGEGIASIVLKPLVDAIRDGNPVRAVIRGTGVNQDGRTPGITLPNSQAQEDLIRSTYARAGLDLTQTRYFEAHVLTWSSFFPRELLMISRALEPLLEILWRRRP
jgi:acyl transferase domain-containing protein